MPAAPEHDRRALAGRRARKDVERRRKREPGGGFLRSLALIGSVGWPIVVLTAGGAFLGHELDHRFHTHVLLAGLGVGLGAVVGSYLAWHAVQKEGP